MKSTQKKWPFFWKCGSKKQFFWKSGSKKQQSPKIGKSLGFFEKSFI